MHYKDIAMHMPTASAIDVGTVTTVDTVIGQDGSPLRIATIR
jgi:hypothetical protein